MLLPWFFLTPVFYTFDQLPEIDDHPWLADLLHYGNSVTPLVLGDSRPALLRPACRTSATWSTRSCAAFVALTLAALVFRRVDDQLAARLALQLAFRCLRSERARREPVERTPVWFMRQAGRSLPGYREIRKQHGLFEVCRQPELCAEVTLEPVRAHGVDAAVMFADIMLPVLGMGVDVELVENVGPVVEEPVRTMADVERLSVPDPEESVPFILEAVRLVRAALAPEQALVGFCGGPFTVAGYLIEGKPTREFALTKRCMYGAPEVWHALMEKLAATFDAYVRGERRGGRRRRSSSSTPGSARSRVTTTTSSSRPTRRASSRPSTCRRSTSARARRTCSRRWPRPAAT